MAAAADSKLFHHIPNYNCYGQQHHSRPYKDAGHLHMQDIRHHKWLQPQLGVRSRSELLQSRQLARVPDSSYDLDGDGTVGQLDLFVGSQFDREKRGHLSTPERRRAREALDNGLLDKYVRGIDSTGKDYYIVQRRGQIMGRDNLQDASIKGFPPHPDAYKVPPHSTKTALELSRQGEAKAAGNLLADRLAAASALVPERARPDHWTEPRTCPIGHVRERAQADHVAAREKAGLTSMPTAVNPERELKGVGLGYVDQPVFATRTQLMETRRSAHHRECEELAVRGAETCLPLTARRVEKASREYEFRRPTEPPMTLTRMQEQRRLDKIEYDMANFQLPGGRVYPRFSDNPEVPFWEAGGAAASQPGSPAARRLAASASEPALKVTEVSFSSPARDAKGLAASLPTSPAAQPASSGQDHADLYTGGAARQRHSKRWSSEVLERNIGDGKPRLFDSLEPYRERAEDSMDLDLHSSMAMTRDAALARLREQRAREREERLQQVSQQQRSRKMAGRWKNEHGSPAGSVAGPEEADVGSVAPAEPLPRAVSKVKITGRPKLQSQSETVLSYTSPGLVEAQQPPRSFATTASIDSPQAHASVRCGGFHKFTPTATSPLAASKSEPRLSESRRGRGASRGADSRGSPTNGSSRGTPTAASRALAAALA